MAFLGTAPPIQLLVLLAIPLSAAVLLAIFIVYMVAKRRKKSKMKLGLEPPGSPPPDEIDTSLLSSPGEPKPAAAKHPLPPKKPVAAPVAAPKPDRPVQTPAEVLPMDTAPQPNPEQTGPAAVELLRLLRSPDGRLIVEVAGRQYTRLADVTDKKTGQFILKLAACLLSFTNGMVVTPAGVRSFSLPPVTPPEPMTAELPLPPRAEPPPPPPPSVPPAKSRPVLSTPPLSRLSSPEPQPAPRRGSLLGRPPAPSKSILPPLNLADEINEIVQARLVASPLAASTEIKITADPGGGIRINVNGQYYAAPDDVPNPEARELIKAAIKQWERS